ncbi:MAG TPA: DoxX family membrane protein [Thermoanaerobaculia bacterium]|jgi:uncharacterized membrane protein YphA (DoxX/SURF4 family)
MRWAARAASLARIAAGIIFVAEGWGKVTGGFVHGDFAKQASGMAAKAWPFWQRFLQGFVLPNAAAIAWLIAVSELALGLGLVLGLWTRAACACGALLVLSFLLGQSYVPGGSWDSWVTAGLTSKFAILLLVLLGIADTGRVWGLDGRPRGRRAIRD